MDDFDIQGSDTYDLLSIPTPCGPTKHQGTNKLSGSVVHEIELIHGLDEMSVSLGMQASQVLKAALLGLLARYTGQESVGSCSLSACFREFIRSCDAGNQQIYQDVPCDLELRFVPSCRVEFIDTHAALVNSWSPSTSDFRFEVATTKTRLGIEVRYREDLWSKEWIDRLDRKSTRLNSSHSSVSRMPSSA